MNRKCNIVLALISRRTWEDNVALPPLGIMSIASWLRGRLPGLDIRLLNQREDNCSTNEIARRIIAFKPDIVGLSALTMNAGAMGKVAEMVNKTCPAATIMIGGPHVSAIGGKKAMESISAAMAAVEGEGEISAEMIVRSCLDGKALGLVPGLIWRRNDGEIIRNSGVTPIVENLDDIPFLAYDLINLPKYWKLESLGVSAPGHYAVLSTSRGCPYACNWCHKISGHRYRAQSAERVVEDIERLKENYGVTCFEFIDDVFNLNPQRVHDFSRLIKQRNLKVTFGFPNGLRTDILTEDVIEALVSAGMNFVTYALESGSPRIQALCGKKLDIGNFVHNVERCARHKVFSRAFAMMGHPSETESELEQTAAILCGLPLHLCNIFRVTPFPGTDLYRAALAKFPERMQSFSYEGENLHTTQINLSEVSDRLLQAKINETYRRFYLHPSRMWRIIGDIPNKRRLYGGFYHVGLRLLKSMKKDFC